jgi:prephenate dehydrogenase
MWRDIALANRKNLARSLEVFAGELKNFQAKLQAGDAAAIETFFTTAKSRRDHWCANGNSIASE